MKNNTPKIGPNESGMSALLTALIVAGASVASVMGVREYLDRTTKVENDAAQSYQIELANETATALLSQLMGNSTVLINGDKFSKNDTMAGNSGDSWKIEGGKVKIFTCVGQAGEKDKIFQNADTTSIPPCPSQAKATTTVSVAKVMTLNFGNFKDNEESGYVMTDTETQLGDKIIKRKVRIRQAEATKVCNTNDPNSPNACNVDHCKFMMPLRDASNKIIYKSGGSIPEIEVNSLFNERMMLRSSPAQTALASINANDPAPINTYNFFSNAYKRGQVDPFKAWQSIDPVYREENYVKMNPDGSLWLDIPNRVTGETGRGIAAFDGFLKYDPVKKLSYTVPWPEGEPYSKHAENFKAACQRTLGTSVPDLCARINVNVKGANYFYNKRRRCYYYGPDNYPDFAKNGLRQWKEMSSQPYQSASDWVNAGDGDKEGISVVRDDRRPWTDTSPHHEIGPAPDYQLHKWTPHVFNDIKVGKLTLKEVKEFNVGEDKVLRSRNLEYTWDAQCEYGKPRIGEDAFGKDFSICFYLTYHNILDRFSCKRGPSDFVCRNLNGCFVGETLVTMADGSQKEIQNVKQGDYVYNAMTKKSVKVQKVIVGEEHSDLYKISYSVGPTLEHVTATHNHPFITKSGIIKASELVQGQLIVDQYMIDREILSIEKVRSTDPKLVWNLLLEGEDGNPSSAYADHAFVAGGLMSGDYYVQETAGFAKSEYDEFTKFLNSK